MGSPGHWQVTPLSQAHPEPCGCLWPLSMQPWLLGLRQANEISSVLKRVLLATTPAKQRQLCRGASAGRGATPTPLQGHPGPGGERKKEPVPYPLKAWAGECWPRGVRTGLGVPPCLGPYSSPLPAFYGAERIWVVVPGLNSSLG